MSAFNLVCGILMLLGMIAGICSDDYDDDMRSFSVGVFFATGILAIVEALK